MALIFLAVAMLAMAFWARQGYRLAESYRETTGQEAHGWPSSTWAMVWCLSPVVAGPIFDRATEGHATATSPVYRGLVRTRPSWLVRTFVIVIGSIAALFGVIVFVGSVVDGQFVPSVVSFVVVVASVGAVSVMVRSRPRG
jgi:hypothetical protein